MPKKQFSIILILVFGLLLRLISINQSLWLDEAISVSLVKNSSFLKNLSFYMKGDFNPPLFNLVLYFWLKVFPAQEFFIRLPSLIFGLGAGIFTYKIAQLFLKKKEAYLPFLLLITSPLHIYYSQEARMYSLAAFTVTGSMYYFIKFLQTKKPIFAPYYLLFTILMLYSHYLCWLILPVQWLYIVLQKNKKIFLNFLINQLLILFSLIPLAPLLLSQLQIGQKAALENVVWGNVVGALSFKNIALLLIKFMIGRTSFESKLFYYLIILLLAIFFGFLLTRAGKKMFVLWLWLVVPPFLGAIISFKIPVFSYFRFLFCLPAFYLLLAGGVFNLKNPKSYLVVLLMINLFFSSRYLFNQDYHRENWKEAIKILHQQNIDDDPVLMEPNVAAPFIFYDQAKSHLVFSDQKETLKYQPTVWLIPYAQPIFDPEDQTRKFLQNNDFVRTYEQHFRGITLEKWQKLMAGRYNLNK